MFKWTILSISMLTLLAGSVVAPALSIIATAFPDTSTTMLKLIITLPSLFVIPFSFISSALCKSFSKRTVVFLGLAMFLVGGVGAAFVNSVTAMLVFRAILGGGIGFLMPLSTSLISEFYEGDARMKMMGLMNASNAGAAVVTVLVAGFLATLSWRYAFGVYLLAIPVAILVAMFLPKLEAVVGKSKSKDKIPLVVYGLGATVFFIMASMFSIMTSMALYLENNNLGDAKTTGMVLSMVTLGGMISSLNLLRIRSLLKNYSMAVALAFQALGYYVLVISSSLPEVVIGVALVGSSFGVIFPTVITIATHSVAKHQTVLAMAVLTTMIYLGQFMSPLLMSLIDWVFSSESQRFQFQVISSSLALASILLALRSRFAAPQTAAKS